MSTDPLALASEFPAATREAWAAAVARVLKGADFDRVLASRTADGIRIDPLYAKAEAAAPPLRAVAGPWRVAQRLDNPDPAEANRLALADLEGGADALVLSLAGAATARGFGLAASAASGLDRAFDGVVLDLIALAVEPAPFAGRAAAADIAALVARRGHAPGDVTVDFGLDPIGDLARAGALPGPWPDIAADLTATVREISEGGLGGTAVRVDMRAYHEAGASEAQELAAALATGVAYLKLLEGGGIALDAARTLMSFLLVADADEFLSIAKLRALRRLWARVEESCGLVPKPLRLHAETAWRMTSRRDPYVNLLRGTLAAFSAGIGGADSVTVLPFTAALGLSDAFARRLARNTQLILLEESNLWRVSDPVAGAGGFEALTEALCVEAWAGFQQIEREGGMVASLESGALAGRIAAMRERRDVAIATRREPLTGTSEFPDLHEAPVTVLMPAPSTQPADGRALPSIRLAEPYEALRDRADAILVATGARPRVFLATLGSLASFGPRASFARNAFAAGGIEALGGEVYASGEALAAAYREAATPLACLCGADDVYAAEAVAAAEALAASGAAFLAIAGRPGDQEAALRAAGVGHILKLGCDLPAFLSAALAAHERAEAPQDRA